MEAAAVLVAAIMFGAVLGLTRSRLAAIVNRVVALSGGVVLFMLAALGMLASMVMMMGSPPDQTGAALGDVGLFFVLGLLSIISSVAAAESMPKPNKTPDE